MNAYNFTDRVRKVLQLARDEAARLRHASVGTEHLLLGLVAEGRGVAVVALRNAGVELDGLRQKVEAMVRQGEATAATGPALPYTSGARAVFEFALTEARELHHSEVDSEHLLLGLLREEQGIAARALTDAALTLEGVRSEIARVRAAAPPQEHRWVRPPLTAPPRDGSGVVGFWSTAPVSPAAFFVRVAGGLWFLMAGWRAMAPGAGPSAVIGLFDLACGALLVAGWRRREAAIAGGFLLLGAAMARLAADATFDVAAFLVPRLVLLLPGLMLGPAADRWSVDGWLRRGRG
jgi:hypothetical protein